MLTSLNSTSLAAPKATPIFQKFKKKKNSSLEGEGINALCQLIGQWVTDSLNRGIDLRKEIDLWLLHIFVARADLRSKILFAKIRFLLELYKEIILKIVTVNVNTNLNWSEIVYIKPNSKQFITSLQLN